MSAKNGRPGQGGQHNSPAAHDTAVGPVLDTTPVYGDWAHEYRKRGWLGTIPVVGKDEHLLKGFHGKEGAYPSDEQVQAWVNLRGTDNIGVRLPRDVIGIDVDAYEGKVGAETLARLESELGKLPRTWRSSARYEGESGIRFYRVPSGEEWRETGGHIDTIYWGNRYAVVYPSIHPATGTTYQWRNDRGTAPEWGELPPQPEQLAWFPERWQEFFRAKPVIGSGVTRELDSVLTEGEPCRAMREALDTPPGDGSRHSAMVAAQLRVVRRAEQGHHGGREAVEEIRQWFVKAIAGERDAEREFDRAFVGAVKEVAANGTPAEYRGCCPLYIDPHEWLAEMEAQYGPLPAVKPRKRPVNLPESFWEARPVLAHIRQAAHSRGLSGDLLFFGTLARLSAMVSHELRFDSGIGGPASLNLFVAALGPSGVGKSSGAAKVRELLPAPLSLISPGAFRDGLPLGSGEGLAEAFMGVEFRETGELKKTGPNAGEPKTERVRTQVRHNVFVYVDEGQALIAQAGRAGATIGPALRSAWIGQLLGQQNAQDDRTRIIEAGSYSLGLLIGFQPATALPLFTPEEINTGTPQRFLWTTVTDPALPEQRVDDPGPLSVGLDESMLSASTGVIPFADTIKDELWRYHSAGVRGTRVEGEPLDAHVPLSCCKVAALLALLDGRRAVDEQDWALSKQVWVTSCAVRDELVSIAAEQDEAARDAQDDRAVNRAVRIVAETDGVPAAVDRLARALAAKVHGRPLPWTRGALRKTLASRDKGLFTAAVERATELLWIIATDAGISAGESRPS